MSDPALALIPVPDGTGTGANTRTLEDELLDRAARDDYDQWLSGTLAAGGCIRPIRLRGTLRDIDPDTGEILSHPRHPRQPGPGDLPAVRGPPRLGLPALRRDLPGRHLPAHPRRARRRQRRPGISRHPPVRVRHLHRPLLRSRPHPRRNPRWQGGPVQAPAQGQHLPARPEDLLRQAAQRGRLRSRAAAVPGLLRLPRRRSLERPRRRAVAPHHHHRTQATGQARQPPRRPGPAVVRQGGRVPAPRTDPLPRHLPARRHRPPPPRADHTAAPGDYPGRAGRLDPPGHFRRLVRHRHPSGQAARLGHPAGATRSTRASSRSPPLAASPTPSWRRTWPSTPPRAPSPRASRRAGSPPTMCRSTPAPALTTGG